MPLSDQETNCPPRRKISSRTLYVNGGETILNMEDCHLSCLMQASLQLSSKNLTIPSSIAGVCFLVGSLFMAMVGLEIMCEKMSERLDSMRGKNEEPETSPAAMVGTFSRYKWQYLSVQCLFNKYLKSRREGENYLTLSRSTLSKQTWIGVMTLSKFIGTNIIKMIDCFVKTSQNDR